MSVGLARPARVVDVDRTEAVVVIGVGLNVLPLPDADALALPTTQTFADGSTEAWTEQSSGADKPKFPVPSATIGQKAPTGGLLPVISWTALGLSVVGLGLGVFAIDRASRRLSAADPNGAAALSTTAAS